MTKRDLPAHQVVRQVRLRLLLQGDNSVLASCLCERHLPLVITKQGHPSHRDAAGNMRQAMRWIRRDGL
jgi:hypothetical protein